MVVKKQTFERQYTKRSGITLQQYRKWKATLPCNCDFESCQGWAAVPNNKICIKDHEFFHAPHIGDKKNGYIWNGEDWERVK